MNVAAHSPSPPKLLTPAAGQPARPRPRQQKGEEEEEEEFE